MARARQCRSAAGSAARGPAGDTQRWGVGTGPAGAGRTRARFARRSTRDCSSCVARASWSAVRRQPSMVAVATGAKRACRWTHGALVAVALEDWVENASLSRLLEVGHVLCAGGLVRLPRKVRLLVLRRQAVRASHEGPLSARRALKRRTLYSRSIVPHDSVPPASECGAAMIRYLTPNTLNNTLN